LRSAKIMLGLRSQKQTAETTCSRHTWSAIARLPNSTHRDKIGTRKPRLSNRGAPVFFGVADDHKERTMKILRLVMFVAVISVLWPAMISARPNATEEVTALLREFIAAAGGGDPAIFDKFFASDVIYTRATGAVITKADIMESLKKPAPASEGKSSYSAEDITVHEYGDTVIVAFQLVGRTEKPGGSVDTAHYRNTGTFLRRNGRWQAVAWQATRISEPAKSQ
jgi:ketosteroid isomerase-like protein